MSTEVPGSPQEQPPATPQQPTPEPTPAQPAASGQPSKDEKTWAMLGHLSGIIFSFLGPLVVWLIQKDQMPFVNDQGKEALNFQITVLIAWIAAGVLSFVGIGLILYPVLWIGNLILCIMAGVKANEGTAYRYPIALRLIS
ncbi:MAG: DUF4870 domain-containing protein [Armatimonadetes bacterium]|nr:DUF4870 domain-containing protein [Armatimonadota bacterium]